MKHLKVRHKMGLLVTVFVILLFAIGANGMLTTNQMADRSKEAYIQNLKPLYLITEIRGNNRAIESFLLENLLTRNDTRNQELAAAIQKKININNTLISQLKAISFGNKEISNKVYEYLTLLPDYRAQRDNIIKLAGKNFNNEGYQIFSGTSFNESRKTMVGLLEDAAALLVQEAQDHNETTLQNAKSSMARSIILIMTAVLLCAGISFILLRLITKPLGELQMLMKRTETGDLTAAASYDSRDEIGQINRSFNRVLESLKLMMQGVSESAEMLSASSQQMSASAEQTARASQFIAETSSGIAAGFEVQTETIERTAQSVQVMVEDVAAVERSSNEISGLLLDASASADHGAGAVEAILAQMKHADSSVSASRDIVSNLDRLSAEINHIITAEATERSTLQITDILTHIQEQTEDAIQSMNLGSRMISSSVLQSEAVSRAFVEIQASLRTAAHQTEETLRTIGHVSLEALSVSRAMEQASKVSRKGTGDVQATSEASEEQLTAMGEMSMSARDLARLAENLHMELSRFKL
ncbi:methyl-accepting chemotaxis protein [Paenibacillus sp. sgz5001063]|uniref:methyl-accepting chemotaxis protein n=1 Tax=Paenibacillus sp. sgz5001063 TaxID=3242474 RepID=UPI0036D23574